MRASLAALHLCKPDAWLEQVPRVLQASGYRNIKTGSALRCWRDEWVQSRGSLTYTDGFQLRRLWIGRGKGALRILPQRIYFDGDGQPDFRPERIILNGIQRPDKPVAEILERQTRLLADLRQADCAGPVVELDNLSVELQHGVKLHSCGGTMPAGNNLRMFLRERGFHSVPADLRAAVIPENDGCMSAGADYANRLTSWFRDRGQHIRVSLTNGDKLDARLKELEQGATPSTAHAPVIFLLGNKGEAVTSTMLDYMRRMDRLGLPWRRAYNNDDRNWSVEDQLGSVVVAAGGLSYYTSCNDEALPWAIGIDISHPRDADRSTACAALTDPGGNLAQAWTITHPRNEEMPEQSIRKLVIAAERKVVELDSNPDILIIRDGRIFENENARSYTQESVGRVTLLELRKGGNPLMLLNEAPFLPRQPAVGFVPDPGDGQHVAFLLTNAEIDFGFAQVLKLHWEDRWNSICLSTEQIPGIVCAMSFAPGLGLHRHTLPAPVYWADGIAGAGDTDLRFRGQPVTRLD